MLLGVHEGEDAAPRRGRPPEVGRQDDHARAASLRAQMGSSRVGQLSLAEGLCRINQHGGVQDFSPRPEAGCRAPVVPHRRQPIRIRVLLKRYLNHQVRWAECFQKALQR